MGSLARACRPRACPCPAQHPDQTAENVAELQAKTLEKGGQPLTLQPGQAFELNRNRGCTDVLFLILFYGFWIGMFVVAGFGIRNGEPERLHYGYDFNGFTCGVGAMSKRPYVYYPFPYPSDLSSSSMEGADFTWATCVDQCPTPKKAAIGGSKIPNSCMMSFQSDDNTTSSPKLYTCGALEGGATDKNQFDASASPSAWLADYKKFCMNRRPLCITGSKHPSPRCRSGISSSTCCLPDATSGEVGSQDGSKTETIAKDEQKQFGITMGYKYGFCYITYPSYVPNSKGGGLAKWTRCLPKMSSELEDTTLFTEAIDSTSSDTSNVSNSMDSAVKAVVTAMSGPRATVQYMIEELRKYKWVILACAGIALAVSIVYTLILRIAAFPLIMSIMVFVWVLLGISVLMLGFKAGYLEPGSVPGAAYAQAKTGVTFGPAETNKELTIAAAALVGACFVAYTILLCVMVPRVKLACTVINLASVCLASMPSTLLFPIIQFIIFIGLSIYFVVVLWYLAAAGSWDSDTRTYVWDQTLQHFMIYHFFGYLWGTQFMLAIGNLAIAGAAAEWFLADDKRTLSAPALTSIKSAISYHQGTAAFGSLIIAVVQLIRWAFRFYMYQIKKLDKDGTFKHVIAVLSCIGECCLDCLERFLNFINKNAYIQTSITGNSFCKAAQDACLLLIRNCLRVGTLQIISTVFIFLGKYFVALLVGVVSAVWMVALDSGGDVAAGWANVSSAPIFPVACATLVAFSISCAFMDVWDMVIDTIFQCYCMDEEYGTGKTPGEMRQCVAENPPSPGDVKALNAVTTGTGQ